MTTDAKLSTFNVIDGNRRELEERTLLSILNPAQDEFNTLLQSLKPADVDRLRLIENGRLPVNKR